jgi:GNAT superfamily N-acetyltransferase
LPPTIRAPTIDELSSLSDLCFRSKAVWGYDEEFMEACRGELSFEPRDLALTFIAVAEHNGKPIGVAQVKVVDGEADLLKLFVEPSALRSGIGKALFAWATGRHATNHRCGPGCRSVLPQDGSVRYRPSTVWLDIG